MMIVHRKNENTLKKLFVAEYKGLRNGKLIFKDTGGYYYQMKIEDPIELLRVINDLVELQNETNKIVSLKLSSVHNMDEIEKIVEIETKKMAAKTNLREKKCPESSCK